MSYCLLSLEGFFPFLGQKNTTRGLLRAAQKYIIADFEGHVSM